MLAQVAEQRFTANPANAEPAKSRAARPLRILHVVSYLRRGGMEFGILKLRAGLTTDEFAHEFCVTRLYDDDFVQQYGLQDSLHVAGSPRTGLQVPLFRLRRIFKTCRPDIVHTRNWGALEAVPAARLAGVPIVIHSEHGYEVDTLSGLPLRRRLFRRLAYSMTDAVFAVTNELREFHARQAWMDPKQIGVIYNGVDTQRFAPCARTRMRVRGELGIPQNSFVIGSVGRMVPIKDYGTLLRAAARLAERGVPVHVLLLGSGPNLAAWQQEAMSIPHLRDRVHFLGASDDVPRVMNAMDVFVLPSLGEGMSNTLLEAMASGLPPIVSRVGGNPEVVKEGISGLLFDPGDVTCLSELIEILFRDPDKRAAFAAAARQRVLERFSQSEMVRRYRELYFEVARRRGIQVRAS